MPGFREEKYDALLPESVEARLLGLSARTGGFVLLALLSFVWMSLLTWSANDPSLTISGNAATGNAGGPVGAVLSDILLQMLGFGAVVCLFAPMLWAIELIRQERVFYFRAKGTFYPLSIIFLAGALATLPVLPSWPLHYAMGGILGDLVASFARSFIGNFTSPDFASVVAGFALLAAGLAAAAESTGADAKETAEAAWKYLRNGPSVERWHDLMRNDRSSAPAAANHIEPSFANSPSADIPQPAPPSETETSSVPHMWQRLKDTFSPSHLQTRPLPAHQLNPTGPVTDVGDTGVAERFASHFGNLHDLVPGSRESSVADSAMDEFDDDEDAQSRRIAERFAPAHLRPLPAGPVEPELSAPHPQSRPQRSRRSPSAAVLMRPPLDLLKRPAQQGLAPAVSQAAARATGQQLLDVLADYGVKGEMRDIKPGPVVTLYEFEPTRGTKSARVIALADDIARSMSVTSVRAAVVPGRNAIGLELPNVKREAVVLREMLESESFRASKAILPLALGRSIGGEPVIADLARMPHLLVAGTTGSGKSVGVNAMILSLLYRLSPDQCRMIMIDPKMLELSVYNGIPHLLTPVVTDPHKAVAALGWAVTEMEERYKRMAALSVRNIEAFNQRVRMAAERGETLARTVQTGFDRATGEPRYETQVIDAKPMPYIVIVVDEFADLMIVAGKDIEQAVQRLAQMARAAGIHLIMATQRPSVDIITGTIKANFPTRISFKVTSKIDSRTILNEQGAEQLLGQGDMLFSSGAGTMTRVHGPFVSDEEVEAVATYLKNHGLPDYVNDVTAGADGAAAIEGSDHRSGGDDLYERARTIVLSERKVSTSYIQRRLSIGYNRAADIIDRMEREGLITPASSTGRREVLKPAA
ncbi:MAG: DNA translocase FtsK [Hyphomicrobium sp.]|nr:DNA translocase FtsK [Hyphomicrobium sp.]